MKYGVLSWGQGSSRKRLCMSKLPFKMTRLRMTHVGEKELLPNCSSTLMTEWGVGTYLDPGVTFLPPLLSVFWSDLSWITRRYTLGSLPGSLENHIDRQTILSLRLEIRPPHSDRYADKDTHLTF